MKHAALFHQAMQAAVERAILQRGQAGEQGLSLRKIAQETGIEVSVLSRLIRGISQPDGAKLSLLLSYLGCDRTEQRWLFHLAGLATPEEVQQAVERSMKSSPIIHMPASQPSRPSRSLDRLEVEILSLQASPETSSPQQRFLDEGQSSRSTNKKNQVD